MIGDWLASSDAVEWLVAAMFLAIVAFLGIVVHVVRRDRRDIDRASRLPLDDGEQRRDGPGDDPGDERRRG